MTPAEQLVDDLITALAQSGPFRDRRTPEHNWIHASAALAWRLYDRCGPDELTAWLDELNANQP